MSRLLEMKSSFQISAKPFSRPAEVTSGAPTAPGAHNTGAAKEPGAVQKGVNKQYQTQAKRPLRLAASIMTTGPHD